jgi:hypothetical protein
MFSSLKESVLNIKSKLQNLSDVIELDDKKNCEKIPEKKLFLDSEKKIEILNNQQTVILNIGGKTFPTTLETLQNFKDSLFYEMLKEYRPGEDIFIDRSYKNFNHILDFLRSNTIKLQTIKDRYIREQVKEELLFYRMIPAQELTAFNEVKIGWDPLLSKSGAFSINLNDEKNIQINSSSCYTHFVTNKQWTDENFVIEFDSHVINDDSYFYIGLVNENYCFTSNCMCCSPTNAFYLRSNGNLISNGLTVTDENLNFNNNKETIGMKIDLRDKTLYFYVPNRTEYGPILLTGTQFRVVSGSCNTTTGSLTILTCYET